MKLSRFGPKSRTVLIVSIALMLALAISSVALGRELRVTTAADLLACADPATYGALTAGPDAGITSAQGDICVVSPATYTPGATVAVTLRSLTIRSREGTAVTVIQGPSPVFSIERDNVTIGGNAPDQGLTIRGSGGAGIEIGGGATPAGEADEDITVQNNFITDNGSDGIAVLTPTAVETFRFEGNNFRGNGGHGIRFAGAVTAVGGSNPEEGVWITDNIFDSNGVDAIHFANSNGVENLTVSRNEILRSGDNGILFNTSVTTIEYVSISGNIIQQNGFAAANIGAGIAFLNTSDIENVVISDNRGETTDQGITGNFGSGILFDGAGTFPGLPLFAGTGVTKLDNITIEGNTISDNGGGGAGIALSLDGITFFNGGDISDLELKDNIFRLNAGNGVLLANGGEFDTSEVSGNLFRNNGVNPTFPFYGDGFAAVVNDNISRITFEGNESRENAVRGVFLGSATGDITEVRFLRGNEFIKNGLALAPGLIFGTSGHGLELSSFGDVTDIEFDDIVSNQNGGSGVSLDALGSAFAGYGFTPPFPGDISDIVVTNAIFDLNGASAPIGAGNGFAATGDTIRVISVSQVEANTNDDHGVLVNSTEDMSEVTVENGEFSGNDRNHDSIGAGVFLDSTEDMDNVGVRSSKVNDNQEGIHFAIKGGNGRAIVVENNAEVNDNGDEGILFDASADLTNVDILNNVLAGNALGVRVAVVDRGTGITVKGNKITGTSGTGILLDSSGVAITENDIRGQDVGVRVNQLEDNQIEQNNIVARHGRFGMDATGLGPGEEIDATDNWWGEPSGPFHPTKNPDGAGSEISNKVLFDPWLSEPAVKTGAYFEVTELGISPTSVDVGGEVTITATVKNTGTEEGSQQVKLTITDAAGSMVGQDAKTATVNKDATTKVTFQYTAAKVGSYQVEVAADTAKSGSFTVEGEAMISIEQAVAGHSGDATLIEDPDIIWAVELWIDDSIVPGTENKRIDDQMILKLVGMWIDETPVEVAAAAVESPKGGSFFDWLLGFFASRSVAVIEHQASPTRVAPGSSFTVTVEVNGEGLLLAEGLPDGWTITPVENANAFYKPTEQKWLWLSGSGTLTYEVAVPPDAAPGTYTIEGSYRTTGGVGKLAPLKIEVAGEPVTLQVDSIQFSGNKFLVEGLGVAGVEAQVWNLAGSPIFQGSGSGNSLALSTEVPLANGVYLYTVTVTGSDGAVVQSDVRKLVLLR